ncbi:MAG: 50S ribosomal protein L3 [Acidobacteriota bacterium]
MIEGLIGKKIGMTQIFTDEGNVVPVTVIKAGPCLVVQKKPGENEKNDKVQLGFVETKKVKNINKPMKGHFDKAQVPPAKLLREFFAEGDDIKAGDSVKADIFEEKELVNVVGVTKGKGFQGVVKRWNFAGGKKSHGSMHHRRPGSIGMCAFPGEVIKGQKMPGRMGGKNKTVKGLKVVKIDLDNNLILLKGAVPGFNGNYVYILKNSFKRR